MNVVRVFSIHYKYVIVSSVGCKWKSTSQIGEVLLGEAMHLVNTVLDTGCGGRPGPLLGIGSGKQLMCTSASSSAEKDFVD